ncbi:MAG: DUF523 domain-containing protein [Candidatus Aenigmarchaeota archaeon]|nr:DUF523 domain-containing protein [Candidatus Aenigmarchaeota archaeon]
MKMVSACLAGKNVRYDGSSKKVEYAENMVRRSEAIAICPEMKGGLPVPREQCEIVGGTGDDVLNGKAKVMTAKGEDVTAQFIEGANETLKLAQQWAVHRVIFCRKSPSCGCGKIFDGTFTGTLREGDGVTTALLKRHGIEVAREG